VLELGCWPGGWLQVLAERVGPGGRVVGVDRRPLEPLGPPVVTLCADFTEEGIGERVAEALGGPAQLLLCDAAPQLTGVAYVDRAALDEIHDAALALAERLLAPRGALVLKGFPGPESRAIRARLEQRFERVSEVRPAAKRASSREFYWVAGPARRRA
jgi:23S rRNA (uridine2552-2'-O)-methyltransferase